MYFPFPISYFLTERELTRIASSFDPRAKTGESTDAQGAIMNFASDPPRNLLISFTQCRSGRPRVAFNRLFTREINL